MLPFITSKAGYICVCVSVSVKTRDAACEMPHRFSQSFTNRITCGLHRWIQKCGWYLAEFYEKHFQDGGATNREIPSFRQYDRYRKYKNIFGLVWPQAFRKGQFFKNRSINNENTRPPSWKFLKNCYSVIYHPILSCDTSLDSEK